jgi:hypothetical protein
MRISGVLVTAVALALVPSVSAANSIAWGPTVNGLRLGASFGSDPAKPTLRVVFENVGPTVQDVLIGHNSGEPIYDSLTFITTATGGRSQEGAHISAFSSVGGMVVPIFVRLNAGEKSDLEFPLKEIIYTSPTSVRLDALVKQGYSVRVRFEVKQASADWAKQQTAGDWAKLSWPWIGTMSSAEVSPAR